MHQQPQRSTSKDRRLAKRALIRACRAGVEAAQLAPPDQRRTVFHDAVLRHIEEEIARAVTQGFLKGMTEAGAGALLDELRPVFDEAGVAFVERRALA